MNIRIPSNCPVGAYRIRPEGIRVDKWTHSGVCDTPLHGMFADIQNKIQSHRAHRKLIEKSV
ncbi:hypothetical protein Bacsa_2726 [Phocaeicola salanitronis DSM 18170]|uniref:Uncharacterized protein n=1 Tax=Phocaeicola salanitronis (strain DSM 18170 / JCM 13657 / CCUG 60908 / BL78) TaxID=667015 RepID=F0R0B5_PHOSB|nr:hypothetical protein Bacsa_2726 [Phocaeicola salanitronis DSM 18170]